MLKFKLLSAAVETFQLIWNGCLTTQSAADRLGQGEKQLHVFHLAPNLSEGISNVWNLLQSSPQSYNPPVASGSVVMLWSLVR